MIIKIRIKMSYCCKKKHCNFLINALKILFMTLALISEHVDGDQLVMARLVMPQFRESCKNIEKYEALAVK